MIVVVEQAVWDSSEIQDLDRLALFAACGHKRHILVTIPRWSPTTSVAPLNQWLGGLPARTKMEIESILKWGVQKFSSASRGLTRIRVVPNHTRWNEAQVTLGIAIRLLQRPLGLLLENRRNDMKFLLRMAEPTHRRVLERAIDRGWVEAQMGGGLSEIYRRVEGLRTPTSDVEWIALARTWTMFDRDADPDDRSQPSPQSRKTVELCHSINHPWPLAYHQLQRRAIENYVPPETVRTWWAEAVDSRKAKRRRQQQAEALLRHQDAGGLSKAARHQLNLKKGLIGDIPERKQREEVQYEGQPLRDDGLDPLFQGLDENVRENLRHGFPDLAMAFSENGAIDEEWFRREVPSTERTALLESLLNRL